MTVNKFVFLHWRHFSLHWIIGCVRKIISRHPVVILNTYSQRENSFCFSKIKNGSLKPENPRHLLEKNWLQSRKINRYCQPYVKNEKDFFHFKILESIRPTLLIWYLSFLNPRASRAVNNTEPEHSEVVMLSQLEKWSIPVTWCYFFTVVS